MQACVVVTYLVMLHTTLMVYHVYQQDLRVLIQWQLHQRLIEVLVKSPVMLLKKLMVC
jgi:hypothetical protein